MTVDSAPSVVQYSNDELDNSGVGNSSASKGEPDGSFFTESQSNN